MSFGNSCVRGVRRHQPLLTSELPLWSQGDLTTVTSRKFSAVPCCAGPPRQLQGQRAGNVGSGAGARSLALSPSSPAASVQRRAYPVRIVLLVLPARRRHPVNTWCLHL